VGRQAFEGQMKAQDVDRIVRGCNQFLREFDPDLGAATFLGSTLPGHVYKDLPHHTRRENEEVAAIGQRDANIGHPHIDLMHQQRRLH
jgi:hypothetical protein